MLRAASAVAGAILVLGATPTPPPQIYHIVTRPLCSELRERIAPAMGMMLQNDSTIKQGPELLRRYNAAALNGPDAGVGRGQSGPIGGDPGGGGSNMSQNIALLGMENLIRPIANNIIAIQTILDSPQLTTGTGRKEDDALLRDIREKLLKALAVQNASLDIIGGFVDTQQMADLQHAGEAYISSITQPDKTNAGQATPAPNSLTANSNYAGLAPNPYVIDPATIPGLTLGYNPVTRLVDGLTWTMDQTQSRENDAAKAVMASAALCGAAAPKTSSPP
jgi:hypothetical protein